MTVYRPVSDGGELTIDSFDGIVMSSFHTDSTEYDDWVSS